MPIPLDCVVIGYNDVSFDDLLRRTEISKDISGGYRRLMVNSVPFQGQRMNYGQLLNSAYGAATGSASRLHVANLPNLGVCYLVSFLRRRGFHVGFINFFNEEREQLRDLLRERPRSVAITTTFYYEARPIQEIVAFVRQHSPETRIIIGGPHIYNVCSDHVPALQDSLLQEIGGDIYVHDSQGETTLAKLCAALRERKPDFSGIPNLVYTGDGSTFERTDRQPEKNSMDTDSVDWRQFDPAFVAPTVQTRTARSCAYKCSFCRFPVMAGDLNLSSLDVVEREMQYLHSIGVERLLFIDDTFNIPLNRFKDLCRMMIRNRFGFQWFSYFRCGNADRESFELLEEAGCKGVFLGIESGDDRLLRVMNKAATADKYAKGIEQLNRRGVITYASFIMGHPGETEESARNTLAFIQETAPMFFSFETFFYDPKVPIASRAFEFGLVGSAYAWRHNTMDWRRASEIVEDAYRTVTNSIVCPLYGFDLWSIAYLMGKGVTLDQMHRFLRIAGQMMPHETGDAGAVALEDDLVNIFRTGALRQAAPDHQLHLSSAAAVP